MFNAVNKAGDCNDSTGKERAYSQLASLVLALTAPHEVLRNSLNCISSHWSVVEVIDY